MQPTEQSIYDAIESFMSKENTNGLYYLTFCLSSGGEKKFKKATKKNWYNKEWQKTGKINDWENRTLKIDVPLIDCMNQIKDQIVASLSKFASPSLLANAFQEGLQCLSLGADDLLLLSQGKSILNKNEQKDKKAA